MTESAQRIVQNPLKISPERAHRIPKNSPERPSRAPLNQEKPNVTLKLVARPQKSAKSRPKEAILGPKWDPKIN